MKTLSKMRQNPNSFGSPSSYQTIPSIFSIFAPTTIAALFFVFLPSPLRAQFAYVANADSGNIAAYSVGSDGALTPLPDSPFAAGIETFSVAVAPSATLVYSARFSGNNISAY